MISRTWHGAVPLAHKEGFTAYEYETGVRDACALPGNRGAYLKIVDQGEYAHFFLCTIWESMEAVIAYAGPNPEIAITYPEDETYGLISDPIVILQQVTSCGNPFE